MINQGEPIYFSGNLEIAEDTVWEQVESLSGYTIDALITNANTNTKLLFSSRPGSANKITISGDKYQFTISSAQSVKLLGECLIELSISDNSHPIISDNRGKFFVQESALGKIITG